MPKKSRVLPTRNNLFLVNLDQIYRLMLRILALHEAQNRPLLYIAFHISIIRLSLKNLRDIFGKGSIDVKMC